MPEKRHDAGIAEADRPLLRVGVPMLADGKQPLAVDEQPPITGRIRRPEAEYDEVGSLGEGAPHPGERRCRHQRRVSEEDQHVVVAGGELLARCKNRMGRPQTLALLIGDRGRCEPGDDATHIGGTGADDDGDARRTGGPAAASTWPSIGRPPTLCITLGKADRMRVPSPAARMMTRQLRFGMALSLPRKRPA